MPKLIGAEGHGIVSRINGAIEFAQKLLATNPAYAKANPQVNDRIAKLKDHNRHYLAHEYFNRDWHPMHISTMADCLAPAKLGFACSAHYLDHIDAINLSTEQQHLLNEFPDPMFKQAIRDFMVNQQFRKDYWVKGVRKLTALEQLEAIRQQRVILVSHRPDVSLKVTGALGEADMSEAVYLPILDYLADHKVRTVAQIEQQVKGSVNYPSLVQALIILAGVGHIAAVQDEPVIAKAKKQSEKLNQSLMQKARSTGDMSTLASPVTGGGITVNRFGQLFLLALSQGKKQPSEWAQYVWSLLQLQGQKIIKEGKTLESDAENLAELTTQATEFAQKQLPILKALQIA